MKIQRLKAVNYRTLEHIDVTMSNYYTAICGKNNSGKSNLIRAIRDIFSSHDLPFFIAMEGFKISKEITINKDVTNWKIKEKVDVAIELFIEINSQNDIGLYKFLEEFILKRESVAPDIEDNVCLSIEIIWRTSENKNEVNLTYRGDKIEDSYQRDEILRKIRSSTCTVFHNSTTTGGFNFPGGRFDSVDEFLSEDDKSEIAKKKQELVNQVRTRLKKQQKEFTSLLGRLEEKYEVNLSVSEPNYERSSIGISLKEKGVDVNLEDWGSGTRNRTLIFLKLLNVKKIKEIESNSDKITPFVIIEEPESFLHPSAQAEFGRVLQDIAEELKIQVIVTTHSVYLLNHRQPESNILLDRQIDNSNKLKGTIVVNTNGDKWYEPFALTLGINGEDFGPLKNTIFSVKDEIILVEGDTDKKYLELLLDERHGENKLKFKGEIFAYNGADNIKNNVLLRFIKGRFSKFLITVDLDRLSDVKKSLESVGLKENIEYISIGKNETGKQNIEGLLPANILSKVYGEHFDLVQKATSNIPEKKEAQNKLKQKLFEAFDSNKNFTVEYFEEFYKLAKKINKVFK